MSHVKTTVLDSGFDARELKDKFIKTAREFLDNIERDADFVVKSGVLSVTGTEVSSNFPAGLSNEQIKVLQDLDRKSLRTRGVTSGSYPDIVENVVQLGLGMSGAARKAHEHTCKEGDNCGINEETEITLPAVDMFAEIAAVVLGTASHEAAIHFLRNIAASMPKLKGIFLNRLKEQDPEKYEALTSAMGIPQGLMDAMQNGEAVELPSDEEGTKVYAAPATSKMLEAILESGAVQDDEVRSTMQEQIVKLRQQENEEREPIEKAAKTSTYVQGNPNKKH